MNSPLLPPGPKRRFPGAILFQLRRGPIEFMTRVAREYGDIAYYRVGPHRVYLLSHPDHVKDVLVTNEACFVKGRGFERAKRLFGEGLLTSEGDFHLRQRRLAQPAFHRSRVVSYGDVMSDYADRVAATWVDGKAMDIHDAMRRVTMLIAGKTLFDADLDSEADGLKPALTDAFRLFETVTTPLSALFEKLPFGAVRRSDAAQARLDSTIFRIIRDRRADQRDRGDLLSILLQAEMTDQQLRDECMTIFLAGHETSANALAWTWYLLSQHPEVQTRARLEVDTVVGARAPTGSDYPNLVYLERVLAESLRLFPPAWMIDRRVVGSYEIGGFNLPLDSIVVVSPYVLHHDARFFPDPMRFDPDRWAGDGQIGRPRYAYFPFGAGSRHCIGEAFAKMSAVLVMASVLRRWTLAPAPDQRADMWPMVTLRPRHGIRVIPTARA